MSQTPHKCLETVITFRASRDLVKTLTERAQERGISRSDLIRECAQQPATDTNCPRSRRRYPQDPQYET